MNKCVFCDILNNKIPCFDIYKNEHVTAFLDINPISPGHILIIPNKHIERLEHIDDRIISNALMESLIHIPKILIKAGICEDFTVLSDNGNNAQQEIKHTHFHIIPRHKNEKLSFDTDNNAAEKNNLLNVWKIIKNTRVY